MMNVHYKGRVEKRKLSKCEDVCRFFSDVQSKYADLLEGDESIVSFQNNVILTGIEENSFSTDFVAINKDGEYIVRECCFRRLLNKPHTAHLLQVSRDYWVKRGITDWGLSSMKKNDFCSYGDALVRVLDFLEENALVIDCLAKRMPFFVLTETLGEPIELSQEELCEKTGFLYVFWDDLKEESKKAAYERFSYIAGVLPSITDEAARMNAMHFSASIYRVTERTIRNCLILFLIYQDKAALAFERRKEEKELTKDQKNFRWALNKYYYTERLLSLPETYIHLLKDKYCDEEGELIPGYPTFYQFRYFYRQTKTYRKLYITRKGLKDYQKNHRPLLSEGIQSFAGTIGIGMIDATIADIFLVNEAGELIGRPVITACIDAYSYYCCGFTVTLEGGIYSLSALLKTVVTNKEKYCERNGIPIGDNEWFGGYLPGTLISDRGSEYVSDTFSQITEKGVKLVNLDSEVSVGEYLHTKLAYTRYRSARGMQRNLSLLSHDMNLFYENLTQNDMQDYWNITKVLGGRRTGTFDICMIGMFLGIPPEDLANPTQVKDTQVEDFDENIRKLVLQGLNYRQIAKQLGGSYDYVKFIGEGMHLR